MRKILALLFAAVLIISMVSCTKAAEDDDNGPVAKEVLSDEYGFEYRVNDKGDYEIVGYTSSKKDVVIQKTFNERAVVGIAADAFKARSNITSVSIPAGITYIGDFAFYGCNSITEIVIPNTVESIGIGAFRECTGLAKITLSSALTSVSEYTFWGCTALEEITIPESVKSIGDGAFWNCDALVSVSIPATVTSVGDAAFFSCDALVEATVADKEATKLGQWVFGECNEAFELK